MTDTDDNELINNLKKLEQYADQLNEYNNYRVHYAKKCDIFSCLFTKDVNNYVKEYNTIMDDTKLEREINNYNESDTGDAKRQACSTEVFIKEETFTDKKKKENHIKLLQNVRQFFIHKNEELRGETVTPKPIPQPRPVLIPLPRTTGGLFLHNDSYEFFFNLYDNKIKIDAEYFKKKIDINLEEIKEQIVIEKKNIENPNYKVYSDIDFEDFIVFLYLLLLCEFLLNIPGNNSNPDKENAALKNYIGKKTFLIIEEIKYKKATLSSSVYLTDYLFSKILNQYIYLDKRLLQKFLKIDKNYKNYKKIFDFWFQIIDKHFYEKKKNIKNHKNLQNLPPFHKQSGGNRKSTRIQRKSKRNSRRIQRKSNRNSRKSQKRRQRRSLRRNQKRRTRRRSQNNKKK